MRPAGAAFLAVGLVLVVTGLLAYTGTIPLSLTGPNPTSPAAVPFFTYTTSGLTANVTLQNVFPSCAGVLGGTGCGGTTFVTWGDGTPTLVNPASRVSHTYLNSGNYTVVDRTIFTFGKFWGVSSTSFTAGISVPNGGSGTKSPPTTTLSASFNYTVSGLSASFRDTSQATGQSVASVTFFFGDGSSATGPGGVTKSHLYTQNGTYGVQELIQGSVSPAPAYAFRNITVFAAAAQGQPCANGCSTIPPASVTNPVTLQPIPTGLVVGGVVFLGAAVIPGASAKPGWATIAGITIAIITYVATGGPL